VQGVSSLRRGRRRGERRGYRIELPPHRRVCAAGSGGRRPVAVIFARALRKEPGTARKLHALNANPRLSRRTSLYPSPRRSFRQQAEFRRSTPFIAAPGRSDFRDPGRSSRSVRWPGIERSLVLANVNATHRGRGCISIDRDPCDLDLTRADRSPCR